MTTLATPVSRPPLTAARWAAPLLGVAVGVLTSFLQGWLPGPWSSLANSASPWLVVAFLVGMLQRSTAAAAVLGVVTCLAEVTGYYGASAARDFGVSPAHVAFWLAFSLLGGPLFGACGRAARAGASVLAVATGAAAPAATFLGEGIGAYGLRLGYDQDAVLFVALGLLAVAAAVTLAPHRLPTLAMACLGSLAGVVVYGLVLAALV